MNPTIQAIVDLVTAAGVIYLAVRMERFIGYIKALETALNAHVNAPGMHGVVVHQQPYATIDPASLAKRPVEPRPGTESEPSDRVSAQPGAGGTSLGRSPR